jgi:phage tail sheath gpL-like
VTGEFTIHGEKVYIDVTSGDALTAILDEMILKINSADDGRLQVVATEDGVDTLTITAAQKGPRGDHIIGADATHGVRFRWLDSNATTVTKGNVVSGTTADDGTAAFASAVNHENYYWVLPWTATGALSATDNQIGEAVANIVAQAQPINGKEQIAIAALRGTQAQATTTATSAGGNSIHAHFPHAESNDWTPAMLAAHYAAVKRSQEVKHPSANIAGYTSTDSTIWQVPMPYLVADRATNTEIRADLNNGVCAIGTQPNGRTYIVRDITSRSQDASGNNDYRAREGHIYSATSFAWRLFKSRYAAQKQPLVDDDPAEGEMPAAHTTTPSSVAAIMHGVIDDLCSSKPLGQYDGPILKPSKKQAMKDAVVATKITAGISIKAQIYAAEHNLKSETEIIDISDAY